MAISKEVLDELMKGYKGPDDFYGPEGLVKQLSKALIERAMQAELTEQIGYEKSESGEKATRNRRNGKTSKTLRTDQGPMEIEVPRDRDGEREQWCQALFNKVRVLCGSILGKNNGKMNIPVVMGFSGGDGFPFYTMQHTKKIAS